jgi:TRAP-type C4-dicarboxylate transport system permease small subunit
LAGQHFTFRWATVALSTRARFWLRRVLDAAIIAVLVVLFRLSTDFLDVVAGQSAYGMKLNMQVPYSAICFGAASLIFIYAGELLDGLLSLTTGRTLSKRERHELSVYGFFGSPVADSPDIANPALPFAPPTPGPDTEMR